MSMATWYFNYRKEQGKIRKGPKVGFRDGTVWHERRAWVDTETGEMTILLNGNAHLFKPYSFADMGSDFIKGHI